MSWLLARQLLMNGAVLGSFYALIGLSWNVIYATTRIFHFAHALVFLLAAYASVLAVGAGWPLPAAILAGIVAGGLAGLLVEVLMYRRFRRAGSTSLSLFLASLGLSVAGANLVQLAFGAGNRSLGNLPLHIFDLAGMSFDSTDVTMVAITWLAVLLLLWAEGSTRWGRALSAVRTNPDMARAVGVSVDRAYSVAFILGSALVAVAAVYFTAKNTANPSIGVDPVIGGLISMFLGGVGNTLGVALGGLVVGMSQNLGGLFLPGEYQVIVSFALLIVILLIRPQGLLGRAVT